MPRATAARALLAAAATAATAVAMAVPATAGPSGPTVRVVVTYDTQASTRAVERAVGRVGSVTHAMTRSPHLVATVPASEVAALRAAPHVRAVQLDVAQRVALDSSLHVIRADVAHTEGLTGAGATVAVIDTGVDVDHPFLGGRVIAQYCSSTPSDATQKSLCPNGLTTDTRADTDSLPACASPSGTLCDHGTHVAGIIAGNGSGVPGTHPAAGVAPGADIIAMQVFTRFDSTSFCGGASSCVASWTSDQLRALDQLAVLDAAHPEWNIVAANMSLGGGQYGKACDTDARKGAIDTLLAQGVATVIAAGNSGYDASVANPACISSAVTVGATDDLDAMAWFSNRGTLLDLLAPGVSITSSVPDDAWATYNGTSMAAPHVAGALALLRQNAPDRPVGDLVDDLRTTGSPVTYSSGGGTVTTPRIDVLAAADAVAHPPLVALTTAPAPAPEGGTVTMSGTWADPDGEDVTLTASTGTLTQGAGTWSWSATRGDDLDLPVTVTATDAGGLSRSLSVTARWTNVAPTATLTSPGTSTWNGRSLVFARVGTPVGGAATVTDPGSDDVSTTWNLGDGARVLQRSPADPPGTDPHPSPSVEPRALAPTVGHTYTRACTRTLTVRATDDDGGASPTRRRTVVVLGTSTARHPTSWWSSEYRGLTSALTSAERTCLLSTARELSTVFAEKRALSTSADAVAVLRPSSPATARATFDARLLAVWLDVATGSVALSAPLDADGNGSSETTVGAFLLAAEHTRNVSSATSSRLPPLTTVLARIAASG